MKRGGRRPEAAAQERRQLDQHRAHLGTKPRQVGKLGAAEATPTSRRWTLRTWSTRIIILRLNFVLRGLKHEPSLEWYIPPNTRP